MRTRAEMLKSRGEQLRARGLSVSATLQLYVGAVANETTRTAAKEAETAEQESQELCGVLAIGS